MTKDQAIDSLTNAVEQCFMHTEGWECCRYILAEWDRERNIEIASLRLEVETLKEEIDVMNEYIDE